MEFQDRLLYHQVHPIKIIADLGSMVLALYFSWGQRWLPALIVLLVPYLIISPLLLGRANLEPIEQSQVGRYLKKYMTRSVEFTRSAGLTVMVVGAWFHQPVTIAVGVLIIAGAWLSGLIFPVPSERA